MAPWLTLLVFDMDPEREKSTEALLEALFVGLAVAVPAELLDSVGVPVQDFVASPEPLSVLVTEVVEVPVCSLLKVDVLDTLALDVLSKLPVIVELALRLRVGERPDVFDSVRVALWLTETEADSEGLPVKDELRGINTVREPLLVSEKELDLLPVSVALSVKDAE